MDGKPSNEDIGAMFLGEDPSTPEISEEPVEAEYDEPVEEVEDEPVEASDEDSGDEPEKAQDESDEPELVEIEWEGQLIEAPKAVAEALMRNSDYTQKTQELAAERKQYDVLRARAEEQHKLYEFSKSIEPDRAELMQADQMIAQWEQHLSQNVTNMDAQQIAQAQLQIKELEKFKANKHSELQQKQQEFQQAHEQSLTELVQKGTEVLRSRIQGWGETHQKAVRDYGQKIGFTDDEINSVIDPRQVEVLWKASQYDQLQSGKAAAVQKVQNAPTIKSKPRNPMPKEVRNKLDLRNKLKSNKLTSAEKQALVANDIGSRWG